MVGYLGQLQPPDLEAVVPLPSLVPYQVRPSLGRIASLDRQRKWGISLTAVLPGYPCIAQH